MANDSRPDAIVFSNVRIFDGKGSALSPPSQVVVRGNKIARIAAVSQADGHEGGRAIDGSGCTLMPGLIDAHWHATLAAQPMNVLLTADAGYIMLAAGREARETLLRGFTSVRDVAGPSFGLKRAIDSGVIEGPRIWPSGAMISQTGGHGDFRMPHEIPKRTADPLSHAEILGVGAIADGPDEVRLRTREQLMMGASQIKLAAGGGVASNYDPLDVSQYTEIEFRAAVEAAENWGTYVTVHAYTARAIATAIRSGVRCIEHGQLVDAPTVRMMKSEGIWWCLQPFLDDRDAIAFPEGSDNRRKQLVLLQGTDKAYRLAKEYGIKAAFGTDTLFDPKLAMRQGAQLAKLTRWYSTAETLQTATSHNAQLLALSGPRNPYPGALGVIEEGALADLLLVRGDPISDIALIENPFDNFAVIVKDGVIYKDATA